MLIYKCKINFKLFLDLHLIYIKNQNYIYECSAGLYLGPCTLAQHVTDKPWAMPCHDPKLPGPAQPILWVVSCWADPVKKVNELDAAQTFFSLAGQLHRGAHLLMI